MNYIYHIVPKKFTGSILYPLNQLKHKYPELYAAHVKKYEGREILLEREIPMLNCLWNDVLHFSPVHPAKICQALWEAGFQPSIFQVYKIDPDAFGFNFQNTVIYLSPPRKKGDFSVRETDFERYSQQKLAQISDVPPATIAYFKQAKKRGERPFLFNHVPHILYRGIINTNKAKIIPICQRPAAY
ncbi:MAG TPA: hypothetical protein EYP41_16365 [Anaerolineae bacterium]|nr:hypothetical protein [Anaerolineae bacterium]